MRELLLTLFCLFGINQAFSTVVITDIKTGEEVAWEEIKDNYPDIVLIDGIFYDLNANEGGTAKVISKIGLYDVHYYGAAIIADDITVNDKVYIVNEIVRMSGDLTSIKFGNNIKVIDPLALEGHINLKNIELPESLEHLDRSALSRSGITSLYLPQHCNLFMNNTAVTTADPGDEFSISPCEYLEQISVHHDNPYLKDIDGVLFTKDGSVLLSYPWNRKTPKYVIPDGTVRSFGNFQHLKVLTLPNSFTMEPLRRMKLPQNVDTLFCYSEKIVNGYCRLQKPENYDNDIIDGKREKIVIVIPDDYKNIYYELENDYHVIRLSEVPKEKCAKPVIRYENGQLLFDCETEGADFECTITSLDEGTYQKESFDMTGIYEIKVFAKANGFYNSDVVTATICWLDEKPRIEIKE